MVHRNVIRISVVAGLAVVMASVLTLSTLLVTRAGLVQVL